MLSNNIDGVRSIMSGKKTVSMQNLADELGISKVTISKALNGKDGVSDELKKKIFQIADQYGYVLPDYGKRKSRKVGIIMSERFNSGDEGKFYMGMYERIVSELRKYSCSSVMVTPNRTTLNSDLQTLSDKGAFDGLIFLGILDGVVKKRLDRIPVGSTTSITDRYLGYVRRLLEQGIKPKDEWNIPDRDEQGRAIRLQLPKELPTAFVCNCDETAFQMVKELKLRGLSVPHDISVVGFDNSIYAELCDPPLTTVAVDIEKIGRIAVRCIRKYMEHPDKKGGEVFRVPGQIVCRNSIKEIR